MVYVAYGPFTNGSAPGLSASLFNDIDNCLTGNLGLAKVLLTTGSIARIAKFSGTGSVTGATHGLGGTPDFVIIMYAGSFGSPPTQVPSYVNTTSTTVDIAAQSAYSWLALAIKFTP